MITDIKITSAFISLVLGSELSPDEFDMSDHEAGDYNKLVFYANDRYNEIINNHLKAKHMVMIITPSRESFDNRKRVLFNTPRPLFIHLDGRNIDDDLSKMHNYPPGNSLVVIHPNALQMTGISRYIQYFQSRNFEIIHDIPPSVAQYKNFSRVIEPLGQNIRRAHPGYWRLDENHKIKFFPYDVQV